MRRDCLWIIKNGALQPVIDKPVLFAAGTYVGFGGTSGSGGYGIRDNGGVLEFKDSGGSWQAFGTGSGTAAWGAITGTLSNQTDLQAALDALAASDYWTRASGTLTPTTTTDYVNVGSASEYRQNNVPTLYHNTTSLSIAIGEAGGNLRTNNALTRNVALGFNALNSPGLTTGAINNFALGAEALQSNTTGSNNIAIGRGAMGINSTGEVNAAIGTSALFWNSTGIRNVAIGAGALVGSTTYAGANGNTAIGFESGYSIGAASGYNTYLGFRAGYNSTTGSYNIILSTNGDVPSASGSYQMNLANLVWGTGLSGTGTTSAGNIGVAVTAPTARLHLPAGTASANTAPLKFTTGTALATPEDGALEYHSSHLYFTIGSTRYQLDQQGGGGGSGDVVGPASAVNNRVVFFDGTTGKLIKDSGLTLSGSNTGDQTITLTGDVTGSGTGSFAATLASTAVTPGSYTNADITVDAKGRITAASNGSGGGGGGGITWNEVTGTSQTAAINNGYITNNAGLVTVTIPTTAAVGSIVRIGGKGAGGWKVAQNASEIIHFGNVNTTTGTGGSLASTNRYDAVELVCIVADTEWVVLSSIGNITIV